MLKIALALLIVASTVSTQKQKKCPAFCEDCDTNYKCHSCFRRKFAANGQCQATQAKGRCLIYNENGVCGLCEAGYAVILKLRENGAQGGLRQQKTECVPINIANCQVALLLEAESEKSAQSRRKGLSQRGGPQYCIACKGGYPEPGNRSCGGFNQDEDSGLEQQTNHCLWGGRPYNRQRTFCFRCKAGYVYSGTPPKCVKSEDVGCLSEFSKGKCFSCDVFGGYYKKTPFTCTK